MTNIIIFFSTLLVAVLLVATTIVNAAEDYCNMDFSLKPLNKYKAGSLVSLSDAVMFTISSSSSASSTNTPLTMRSADFFIMNNNTKVTEAHFLGSSLTRNNFDSWGQYDLTKVDFAVNEGAIYPDFSLQVLVYFNNFTGTRVQSKLVFRQFFYSRIPGTQNNKQKNWNGDSQQLSTSFPSFWTYNPQQQSQDAPFGWYHFAGYFSGWATPSSGNSASYTASENLYGGIRNASVITFFNDDVSVVVSPASEFVVASLEGFTNSSAKTRQVRWGLNGNVNEIISNYSAEWVFRCNPSSSVNMAMRNWGKDLRGKYNKGDHNVAHARDETLRTIGYSTDNGAGGYYVSFPLVNPNNKSQIIKNYQEYMLAVKAESVQKNINFHWAELDSWWYYRAQEKTPWGSTNGLLNWTARPDIFPDGLQYIKDQTGWPFQLHNRYFAPNNVYASNPQLPIGPTDYKGKKFEFVFSEATKNGIPPTAEFWQYFFEIKQGSTGGVSYIQDWISLVFDQIEQLTSNVTLGSQWLGAMARGAEDNGWSIQYCMSYPRAVLESVKYPSVTQTRASDDYQPQTLLRDYYQWRIGDSSLFSESLGLAPAKDNFWTSSKSQIVKHYDPFLPTYEHRNRLESLTATMSNSIVAIGDSLGYMVREIVMLSCNEDGLLLRPSQAATPLDSWFKYKAFDQFSQSTPRYVGRPNIIDPVVQFTFSKLNKNSRFDQLQYFYLLSVNNGPNAFHNVTFEDLLQSAGIINNGGTSSPSVNPFQSPVSFIAWEFNSSASSSFVYCDSQNPLLLNQNSNELTFEYFTFAPVYSWMKNDVAIGGVFPILLGETGKWISASEQRISSVKYSSGMISVFVNGAVGEMVSLVFAQVSSETGRVVENSQARLTCKIGRGQTSVFYFKSSKEMGCDF